VKPPKPTQVSRDLGKDGNKIGPPHWQKEGERRRTRIWRGFGLGKKTTRLSKPLGDLEGLGERDHTRRKEGKYKEKKGKRDSCGWRGCNRNS